MIKSIEIEIEGQTFKLSPDDAKKLYSDLHALYGEKEVVKWYPTWQWQPGQTWYHGQTLTGTGTGDGKPLTSGYMRID
jgi:hypothetical protein